MSDDDQTPRTEAPQFDTRLLMPEPPSPPRWSARFSTPLTKLDAIVLALIVAATLATYLLRLGVPGEEIPLDERHYVPDARDVLMFGTESDGRVSEESGAFVVHPPVGKWFIAAGIKLFGDDPFGWRFFGALFGAAAVGLVYLIARRLWASAWFAALASLLLAVEGLWFVQSRTAMLDIYAAFFILAGVWMLLEDRDATGIEHRGVRPWRLAAGAAFGFAIATKWSALPFWVMAIGLAAAFEWSRLHARRRASNPDLEPPMRRQAVRAGASILAGLLVLPLALYFVTFTPWFVSANRYDPPRCEQIDASWFADDGIARTLTGWTSNLGRFGQWLCYQREIVDFHRNLSKFQTEDEEQKSTRADGTVETTTVAVTKPSHPYFGEAWSWPWVGRPVAHYFESTGEGDEARRSEVLGAPNPVIWMPAFVVAIPALAWWSFSPSIVRWRRRRRGDGNGDDEPPARGETPEPPGDEPEADRVDRAAPVLLAMLFAGWAPMLFADAVGRPVFMFYALPMVPFLVLAVVHVLVRATRGGMRVRWLPMVYAGLAVLAFAYLYPVYAAWPLPVDGFFGWSGRILYGTQPWSIFGWDLPFPDPDCGAVNVVKKFCWI